MLGIVTEFVLSEGKKPIDRNFSVSDPTRQYLGYLDFALDNSCFNGQPTIGFEYGSFGYSTAKLFRFDQELIDTCNLKPT
ncbi:unnamed protein product [Rotaria sp. Silwood2]|nr:unnamed protein product [Rotaria sp. Silwood2]CAF2694334.1 unnamed protein product [Rotaria sp. Silwood2]CAF4085535.1 unnamed protein product [Rotaria sp. Silwood2]CAF4247240.1 unnamed protein product [Rotaria sp. Silwood2]